MTLRDVRAQRKADKEVEELLKSESPLAAAKAFALGLTTGTAMSYVTQAPHLIPQVSQVQQSIQERAHLAHWLDDVGMPTRDAHRAAAGLQKFLSQGAPSPMAERIVKMFGSTGFQIEGSKELFSTKQQAEAALKHLGEAGAGRSIDFVRGSTQGPTASDIYPTTRTSRRVLDAARESFEAAGKQAPGVGKALGVVLRKQAPYAAVAGLFTGLGAAALTRKRRKELTDLRRYAREH